MRVGSGSHTYEVVENWAKLPPDISLGWIGGVATDSAGRVFCFCRGTHPMIVFDREGNIIDHWGDDLINHPHGVFLQGEDTLWLTDRFAQVVWVYNTEGELQRKLGYPYIAGEYGCHFNHPTNTYVTPDGTIFVSNGYRAPHFHRFSAAGVHQGTWGEPGDGPGQFNLPHGIWVLPDDRVLVADRENNRVQVFTRDGDFLEVWDGFRRPTDFHVDDSEGVIFMSELDRGITLLDYEGAVITSWGEKGEGPGQYLASHGICVDDQGAIYMGEVGRDDAIHKFIPVR